MFAIVVVVPVGYGEMVKHPAVHDLTISVKELAVGHAGVVQGDACKIRCIKCKSAQSAQLMNQDLGEAPRLQAQD